MGQRKQSLKILGMMLLVALGLMIVSTSAALAEGKFQILQTEGGTIKETGAGTGTGGAGKLLLASGLTIACTSNTGTYTLQATGMVTITALFSGCMLKEANSAKSSRRPQK